MKEFIKMNALLMIVIVLGGVANSILKYNGIPIDAYGTIIGYLFARLYILEQKLKDED